jgi:amino acid permease
MKNSVKIFALLSFFTLFSSFASTKPCSYQKEQASEACRQSRMSRQRMRNDEYKVSERQKRVKRIINITIGTLVGTGLALGLSVFGILLVMTIGALR